jgi:hypothetical protein
MPIMTRKGNLPTAIAIAHNNMRKSANVATTVAFGQTTLVTGTKTVSQAGITSLSVITLTLTAHGGTAGARYKVVPSAGQFIVTAVDAAGATVATDTSSFNWVSETPQFHMDQSAGAESGDWGDGTTTALSVTAATAVDLATSITLANNIRQVLLQHMPDAVAHPTADTTNTVATAVATDLTSVEALLNACKTAYNAHLTQATVHFLNDTIDNVATANATDQTTSNALANALKTAINAHMASAAIGDSVVFVGP